MAGESPDKSKQRESSAGATSGSAAPVPEARDPRLAVAREKDSSGGAADTATKVLSVRDVKKRAEEEPSTPTPTPTPAPAPEKSTDADEAKSDAEDAALRDAVSAWVRSADPKKRESDATAKPSPESPAQKDTSGDEPEKADAEKTEADAAEAEEADAEADEPTGAAEEPDAEAEDETEPEPEDAKSEAEADAEDRDDVEDAKPEAGDQDPVEDAKPDAGVEDAEAEEPGDEPDDADGEDAPQGTPAADDESRTGGAGGKKDAEGAAEAEDADAPQATAEAEDADAPQATAEAEDADAPQAAVDQPTTVFKAVRPKKPEVDQPTTMLKLGGAPKAPKAPESPKAPEADPERTSKFIALKSDVTTAVPQVGPERTTQQPLPPKPPLDLLAELTNTPPPPETPVRTLVRRVKIWTPLVLLLVVILGVVQTMRPLPRPTLDLTAQDSYTFGGAKPDIPWPSQGQAALDVQGIGTFGSSGTQKPVPIASVAKVMTAYIILHDHPLKSGAAGPKIKIDKPAEQQSEAGQESTVHVTAGDSITQREALESILIASANNIARLLARWDEGSEKAFVSKMNATAKSLGMTNTTYTDPSGLTNSTVSTAVDQVKLAKAAMTEPAFREVAAMMSYDDYKGVNHSNWNHLVGHNNVVGIKTGTTTSALGNLVFAAKQQVGGETRTVVGAVIRQPAGGSDNTILSGALDAADKLIRAGQGALKSATILKKGDVVGYVDDGLGGRTPVVATKDVTAAGWSGLQVKLSFTPGTVPHTAKAGTQVGSLTVGDGSAGAVQVPVALEKDLTEPGFTAKLTRIG
ncbi:D-alanyl-D-alanine carboxypeptidase [Streptomyces sp. NPDC051133]|uniref:D-alanyl-D-alanine carboxypeptidase n=1 Tax=Streptomyces sp. NPDC051133 TaxID=3155521 RepID=UPI003418717D